MNKMKFNNNNNKKKWKQEKNQIENSELENTTITLKLSVGNFTNALSQREERIGDFEDTSFKSIQSEEQKKIKKLKIWKSTGEWTTITWDNICIKKKEKLF